MGIEHMNLFSEDGDKTATDNAESERTAETPEKSLLVESLKDRFFPLYDSIFSKWMNDKTICSRFLTAVTGREVSVDTIITQFWSEDMKLGAKGSRIDV
ncbi:MAG: hypothetical protein LBS62_01155, partial [Clostridiales bacterium]|nr:hypothetical protein [Clostridiales bacterium]